MKPPCSASDAGLETRWDRIGLGVRCAYNPGRPEVLNHYVHAGRRLSRLRPDQELRVQRRMLELLLRTATDEALPWPWRAACLEHWVWPLARLTSLLGTQPDGSEELARIQERVQRATDTLGLPPRRVGQAAGAGPGPKTHG